MASRSNSRAPSTNRHSNYTEGDASLLSNALTAVSVCLSENQSIELPSDEIFFR